MTAHELIAKLSHRQVTLYLEGDKLRYRAPAGALTKDLREAIATHRAAIVEIVRQQQENKANRRTTCITCDWLFWVDEPSVGGRIRTTCGRCGRFIGYRPSDN